MLTVNPLPMVQLAALPSVCISAPPFILRSSHWEAARQVPASIHPQVSSTLLPVPSTCPSPICYTNPNGCTNAAWMRLRNPFAFRQLAPQPSTCISTAPFPVDRRYAGRWHLLGNRGQFLQSIAGLGSHLITYSYTNGTAPDMKHLRRFSSTPSSVSLADLPGCSLYLGFYTSH